jgi:hypothetical protein
MTDAGGLVHYHPFRCAVWVSLSSATVADGQSLVDTTEGTFSSLYLEHTSLPAMSSKSEGLFGDSDDSLLHVLLLSLFVVLA